MVSKTENFYKTEKVAWDVSKPGYLSESGNVTLTGDKVINVDLLKDTDWIWTNIPSEIRAQYLKFTDGYKPNVATNFSTPLSVRNHLHKISSIDFSGVYHKFAAPILFTEGLTRLEVYSDFLETFYINTQIYVNIDYDPENVDGNLEQIILSHTPNLTTFSVKNSGKLRELYADDFSHVTSMKEAFYGNNSLEYISPMYLDSCTDLNSMFVYCKFSEFPTTLHNTSNVKSTDSMFYKCRNLISVPLFDTQNVTNMQDMFYMCTSLTTVPLFNTQNVTDMGAMFSSCKNLITVPLFNTQNVTDMSVMFAHCDNLTTVPSFDMSNVTEAYNMFIECKNLTTTPSLNMPNVTSAYSMFAGCKSLTSVPSINIPNVKYIGGMFEGCTNLTSISEINTSNSLKDTHHMFYNCKNLTSIPEMYMYDVGTPSSYDTINYNYIRDMFYGCTSLTDCGGFKKLRIGIDLSYCPLTHESAMNVINKVTVSGYGTQIIKFSRTTFNTLSAEDIKIATKKGWEIAA